MSKTSENKLRNKLRNKGEKQAARHGGGFSDNIPKTIAVLEE